MGGRNRQRPIYFHDPPEDEEAARRFLDREVGSEATWPAFTKIHFDLLERRYVEERDRLALLDCVVLARQRNAMVPRWALDVLANAFEEYVLAQGEGGDQPTLDRLLLTPDKKRRASLLVSPTQPSKFVEEWWHSAQSEVLRLRISAEKRML